MTRTASYLNSTSDINNIATDRSSFDRSRFSEGKHISFLTTVNSDEAHARLRTKQGSLRRIFSFSFGGSYSFRKTSINFPRRKNCKQQNCQDQNSSLPSGQNRTKLMQQFLARKLSGHQLTSNYIRPLGQNKPCRPTFVFDPDGKFLHYWKLTVSLAFLYNLWIIGYRYAFDEIRRDNMAIWLTMDYLADTIYILDIVMGFRTAFLEDGVLQTTPDKLKLHYFNTPRFYLDCLCLLPLDLLYLSWNFCSLFRGFRLIKMYRFFEYNDSAERHSSHPILYRLVLLVHCFLVIFHWNACFIFVFKESISIPSLEKDPCRLNANGSVTTIWAKDDNMYNYLLAYYASGKMLTLAELPVPRGLDSKLHIVMVISEMIMGLVVLSAALGFVATTVASSSAVKKDFQTELDAVKQYMNFHMVPSHLQAKVIRWFDYLWYTQRASTSANATDFLPDKLKAEIALHVNLDTLKKVEIFQNAEPGFLKELVLRLKPMLCLPGDYVCRKGEVGKEMFIVCHGRLKVLSDDGKVVLATLKAGSYFGEIAILNMGVGGGNRRTASVVSVGYSDLFCLTKDAIDDVLKDYPTARMRLEQIAHRRLHLKKAQNINIRLSETNLDSKSASSAPGCLEGNLKLPVTHLIRNRQLSKSPASNSRIGESIQRNISGSDTFEPTYCNALVASPYSGRIKSESAMLNSRTPSTQNDIFTDDVSERGFSDTTGLIIPITEESFI